MSIGQEKAELECSITASWKEDGTDPISNGDTEVHPIPDPTIGPASPWIHFNVMNTGFKEAKDFQIMMLAANGNFGFHYQAETISMGPHALPGGKTYSIPINAFLTPGYNNIKAHMFVDVLESVPEYKEYNNFCSFEFKLLVPRVRSRG